jgi:FG-GAP-like repeat
VLKDVEMAPKGWERAQQDGNLIITQLPLLNCGLAVLPFAFNSQFRPGAVPMQFRRSLPSLAVAFALSYASSFGQTPAKFTTVSSNSTVTGAGGYTVDVNNDGLTDIIQPSASQPYGFTVFLAKGDGTFTEGSTYAFPSGAETSGQLAFADVNNDGKVDIVSPVTGKNELVVYLGNGNGTFQPAKIFSNVLPSGMDFQNEAPIPADFNHDGKIDLVAFGYDDSGSYLNNVVILEGEGNGEFTYNGVLYNAPANFGIGNAVTGDFNADNNADVAFTTGTSCDSGGCDDAVHVLYGNGDFGFKETTPFSINGNGNMSLSAGDLNGDGTTDLFGYDSATNQLVLLYGQTNETFTTYYHTLAQTPEEGPYLFVMADFNGDRHMDLAAWEYIDSTTAGPYYQMAVFLADSTPGGFTEQDVSLPYYTPSSALVGNFTGNAIPDVVFVEATNGAGSYPTIFLTEVNETPEGYWGGCNYPKTGAGVTLCFPSGGSSGNPVDFKASATSFGDIRKFELWVDGRKLSEQHNSWGNYAWFNLSTTLAAGKHSCTLNVTTIDNDAKAYNFNLTVQ